MPLLPLHLDLSAPRTHSPQAFLLHHPLRRRWTFRCHRHSPPSRIPVQQDTAPDLPLATRSTICPIAYLFHRYRTQRDTVSDGLLAIPHVFQRFLTSLLFLLPTE